MRELELTTGSAEETQELGRQLGAQAQQGDLVLLSGELGSGKTTLTQGIAWGLGVHEYAHSPTFVLMNEYQGRVRLYHVDLYRLEDPAEVHELGIPEVLADGVCVVEWAEKAMEALPAEHLLIELVEAGPEERWLRLRPQGDRYMQLLSALEPLSPTPRS